MSDLFNTGIIPAVNEYLLKKAKEERNYGDYWSASSAGYCMRLNIMRRLGVPKVPELEDNATQTRIFEAGHIFHEWLQRITKDAGLSIASEVELQDEDLMIRGHFDDLVLVGGDQFTAPVDGDEVEYDKFTTLRTKDEAKRVNKALGYCTECKQLVHSPNAQSVSVKEVKHKSCPQHLILYDYKTAHSASFNYKKRQTEIGHYHKHQLGTYIYMLRKLADKLNILWALNTPEDIVKLIQHLSEARILSISKDDLRMHEQQLLWSPQLEKEIYEYWATLNGYWKAKKLPKCTCLDHDGGFMGKKSAKGKFYNDYFYKDEPCSMEWYKLWKEKQK